MKPYRLRNRIENVISGKEKDSNLEKTLTLVSKIYALGAAFRLRLYKNNLLHTFRLPCKVISIGNITLGGTGKTPMVIYLAELIKSMGVNPAVVCRGYKGKCEHSTGIVTDGNSVFLGPEQAGDEPYLIATRLSGVPVVVGKNRYQSGMKTWESFQPDVIILDDAFQHIRLFRDLNLLLVDASNPFGNGRIFPRGILREPLNQIFRADAFVITRAEPGCPVDSLFTEKRGKTVKPVFRCRHLPDTVSVLNSEGTWVKTGLDSIRGKKCLAFSGIAKNEDFFLTLTGLGCFPADFIGFPDHHEFSSHDIKTIIETAQKKQVEFLITTEKDRVKISKNMFSPMKIYSLGVNISFIDEDNDLFRELILRSVSSRSKGSIFIRRDTETN